MNNNLTSEDKVRVVFFASLREAIGTHSVEVYATNVAELFESLTSLLGNDAVRALKVKNVRLAVNQELVVHDAEIKPGDEIAFLPPVTGG